MAQDRDTGKASEGPVFPTIGGREYFGVYKYNEKWNVFLMRLEDRDEFYQPTQAIMFQIGAIILLITLIFTGIGMVLVRFILRFVRKITEALMHMQESQRLELIDLSEAPNDDVTYLGASFNSLSSSIDNLMTIFRSFVSQDVVQRAYKEREIRLEGTQRDLTILFTDIKGFTYMTETLGNDIIALLNLHYDRAIRRIHEHYGIVGSIIGDALLSVYGRFQVAGSLAVGIRNPGGRPVPPGRDERAQGGYRARARRPQHCRAQGLPCRSPGSRRRNRRRRSVLRQHRLQRAYGEYGHRRQR